MTQSRIASAAEVATNITTGFAINWAANVTILPAMGYQITGGQAFGMGLIITVISVIRGYVIRRAFNWGSA